MTEQQLQPRTHTGWKLGILWNLGLFSGILAMSSRSDSWRILIPQALGCTGSFAGALVPALFPVAVTVTAVILLGNWIVWVLCPVRAFALGMCIGAIGISCGPTALPAAVLLLFSGLISTPVLMLFWHQRLTGGSRDFAADTILLLALNLGISALDHWIVSPFLTETFIF